MEKSGRISNSLSEFARLFNKPAEIAVSSPGRVELIGNHTDHQCGCVLAASVGLDTLFFASKRRDTLAVVRSEGFAPFEADLSELKPQPKEEGTSAALVRGVASRFNELGYKIGGFEAFVISDVPPGSGLSSSAAFELAVCSALNHLYNEGGIDSVTMAKTARYAENRYFMKPCGLMDQMACSLGGAVAIDMKDPEEPIARRVPFDADGNGFALCITSTGGCHSDLTGEYAAIPNEMHDVADFFGKKALRFCSEAEFYDKIGEIEKSCGERAVKRAMHFFGENRRAMEAPEALTQGDFSRFVRLMRESGKSSEELLQNTHIPGTPLDQGIPLGLKLSGELLKDKGASRVHGGGFAGTVIALVPNELLDSYRAKMDGAFGPGSCRHLHIREDGAMRIL